MRKLWLLLLLLIPALSLAAFSVDGIDNPASVDGIDNPAAMDGIDAGIACSEGTTTDVCTTTSGESDITSNPSGATFTLASEESWWGVALRINAVSSAGSYNFKFGTNSDLSNPSNVLASVDGVVVSSTDTGNYSVVQFPTCLTLPAGTYYMGVVAASGGNLDWQRDFSACANQSSVYSESTSWNMDQTSTTDYNWKKILNGG